jgi:hypothetical protein
VVAIGNPQFSADVVVVELVVVVFDEPVVDDTTEPVPLICAQTRDIPEELSVTSSADVSGSTRVRQTVAKPVVDITLLSHYE